MGSNNIKLSIIIPVYNTEQYLRKCLSSIFDQDIDLSLYEVIIVNDGSPDNSQTIIDEFCSKYNNSSCIVQENQGQSVARNRAIEVAQGDYIWFVDSDDWIEKDSIHTIISECSNSPDVVMIARAGSLSNKSFAPTYTTSGREILLNKHFEQGPVFYILNHEFVKQQNLRFVPGIYHEDSEIIPKFLYIAKTIRVIQRPLYHVYANPTSTTRSTNPKKSHDLLIVADNLLRFQQTRVEDPMIDKVFNYLISVDLNNALANIIQCDITEQQKFNKALHNKRYLLFVLWRSTLKYRVEFFLFKIFPKRYVKVYKILKLIH